jgi:integrase
MTKIYPTTWKAANGEVRSGYRIGYYVAGKKRFKQSTDLKKLQRFVRRLDSHITAETIEYKNKNSVLVSTVADDWLKACKVGKLGEPPLQPETIKTYTGYVENYIKPLMGSKRITEVTRKDCVDFRTKLLEECNTRITAKKIFVAFRSILDFAFHSELIDSDPSHKLTIKLGRHYPRIEIHTKRNMAKIITLSCKLAGSTNERTKKTWTRYSLMLMLLVYCGLRLSELRGLPRDALDLKHAQLTVRQRADRAGRIGPPKSERGHRTLYIPDVLLEPLSSWLRTHNHTLVFPSASGAPLYQENIRKRMWTEIQTQAEVPHLHIHSTRHFYASRLIESGATVKEVSTDMGHADEAFTLRVYGHLFKDSESEKRRRSRVDSLVLVRSQSPEASEPDRNP